MCEVYVDDYERPSVWSETKARARKSHICAACRGTITPSEIYWRHFSAVDSVTVSEKFCAACAAVRDDYQSEHGVVGVPSSLMTELVECVGPKSGRKHWGEEERRWRRGIAGMLLRWRARNRSERRPA